MGKMVKTSKRFASRASERKKCASDTFLARIRSESEEN